MSTVRIENQERGCLFYALAKPVVEQLKTGVDKAY